MSSGGRDVSIYRDHDFHIQIRAGLPGLDLLYRLDAVDPQTSDTQLLSLLQAGWGVAEVRQCVLDGDSTLEVE